jgi:hypothetical protein
MTALVFEAVELKYDVSLSNFACSFNLRRYIKVCTSAAIGVAEAAAWEGAVADGSAPFSEVGTKIYCPQRHRHTI